MLKKTVAGAVCVAAMLVTAGCGGESGGKPEGKASQDSASPSPTPTAKPLNADLLAEALLTPEDMPGWQLDGEDLKGDYQVDRQNFQGWKSPSASCNAFVSGTNRAIGKPVAAVHRQLKTDGFDQLNTVVRSYRDDIAAKENITQIRQMPEKCPEGGTVKGVRGGGPEGCPDGVQEVDRAQGR